MTTNRAPLQVLAIGACLVSGGISLLGCRQDRVVSKYNPTKPEIAVTVPRIFVGTQPNIVKPLELPFGKRFEVRGTVSGVSKLRRRPVFLYVSFYPDDGTDRLLGSTLAYVTESADDALSFSGEMVPFRAKREMVMQIDLDNESSVRVPVIVQ